MTEKEQEMLKQALDMSISNAAELRALQQILIDSKIQIDKEKLENETKHLKEMLSDSVYGKLGI